MEEGTHEHLIAQRGAYWRLYEAQARQEKAERDRMLAIEPIEAELPPLPEPERTDRDVEADPNTGLKEVNK